LRREINGYQGVKGLTGLFFPAGNGNDWTAMDGHFKVFAMRLGIATLKALRV
jgi:hypothetical protein